MFKNAAYKIYLLLASVIVILGVLSVLSSYYFQKQNIELNTHNQIVNYHSRLQSYIDEEAHMMESFLELIQEKKELQNSFITSNKEELFKNSKPIFDHLNQSCDITHFYFIQTDGKILLRTHEFDRDGDIVNRFTFLQAKKTNSNFYGIEFGIKKNYTLRVVAPWMVDGKIIGYIELGKEIDKISKSLSQQLGIEILYGVNKTEYKDAAKFIKEDLIGCMQTKEHYIVYQTILSNKKIIDFIDIYNNQTQWINIDNRHYIGYVDKLKDVSNKELGIKVYLVDVTTEYNKLVRSIIYYSSIMVFGTILLLSIVYFFVRKKQSNLDEALLEIEKKALEQKHLLSLFDKGDSVLFRWNNDANWSINYVSSNVENLLGYTKEEFLKSEIVYADCIFKDDLTRVFEEVYKGKESKEDFFRHEPYRVVTKYGDVKWVLDYTVLDKDIDENLQYYLGYIIDITTQQEHEKMIRAQKEEFEAIFKYSKDGIAILNVETNFLDFNDAYLEITGFTREELLKKSCIELTAPEYKERGMIAMQQVLEIGHIENFEKMCIVNEGKRIMVNMSASMLPDKKRVILVAKDVTSLKLLEEQTKLASMGEMIGNIAHQWRQPLSVISTNATGMIMQQEYGLLNDEKLVEACNQINENAQYLSKTIDDFKNFIKGDVDFSLVNVKKVIDESLSILKASVSNNYITLVLSLTDDAYISANKNELEQAIINIINNAKDALVEKMIEEERFIFISTKKIDSNKLSLKILDNGGGIPLNIIEKIFEPYFTTKHQSQGTGLGLSMVAKIIRERHQQALTVYNEEFEYQGKEYKGACFEIIFTTTKDV